jgi:hypothetical protein
MAINSYPDNSGGEVNFPEQLIDPVSKFRVSNPENLIDTDFEYGLQPTKWETVELINNTPSFFSKSGDTTIDGISSIITNAGTREIIVKTELDHGLAVGIPINVTGTKSITADGAYIINSIPDTKTFTYLCKDNQTDTNSILDLYSSIITGEFFQGSQLRISDSDGIITDAEGTSILTVTTNTTHGFGENTPFYFLNLNSTVAQEFQAANTASKSFDASNSATAQTFDGSNSLSSVNIDWSNSATFGGTPSTISGTDQAADTITVTHQAAENFNNLTLGAPLYYAVSATGGYFNTNPRGVVFLKTIDQLGTSTSTFQVSLVPDGDAIDLTSNLTGTFQIANQARTFAGNNINPLTQTVIDVEVGVDYSFDAGNQGYTGAVQETPPNNTLTVLSYTGTEINADGASLVDYYVGAMVRYTTTGNAATGLSANTTYFVTSFTNNTGGNYTFSVAAFPGGAPISITTGSGTGTQAFSRIGVSLDKNIVHIPNSNFSEGDMLEYSFPVDGRFEVELEEQEKIFYFVNTAYDAHNYTLSEDIGFRPIVATGGTLLPEYTDKGRTWRSHQITTVGTTNFVVSDIGEEGLIEYLIVAGGGGGGSRFGGGGGAGGVVSGSAIVTTTSYPAVVGGGGLGGQSNNTRGSSGSNSTFLGLTAIGGGGGAAEGVSALGGGSGGGGSYATPTPGTGTSLQGFAGGVGQSSVRVNGGGGGAAGPGSGSGTRPNGGIGIVSFISGSYQGYGGGGGGADNRTDGAGQGSTAQPWGFGGFGGGGAGGGTQGTGTGDSKAGIGENGIANTGGGGGGGAYYGGPVGNGGNGGSGVVIVRYPITPAIPLVPAIASGGAVTEILDSGVVYKVHTFTSGSSTFAVQSVGSWNQFEYLVVAGGGAGGDTDAGGGGAGGMLTGRVALEATSYAISVGAGAPARTVDWTRGDSGANSSFGTIAVAVGGGGGGSGIGAASGDNRFGRTGGSGGGSGTGFGSSFVGAGTVGQGNSGGFATGAGGGGGGGAGGVGFNGRNGNGGIGRVSSIVGVPTYYAGGGGGGHGNFTFGGLGGGANGFGSGNGQNGQANTGGGGSGGGGNNGNGGAGGSGIVIVRYPVAVLQPGEFPVATGGAISVITDGTDRFAVHSFRQTGSSAFTITNLGSVSANNNIEYLIVAGGGGGGTDRAGGGGAGGMLTGTFTGATAQSYNVTVGQGGAGATNDNVKGVNGGNSSVFNLTAFGGGGGGSENASTGANGGSGGGSSYNTTAFGSGTSGQGNRGGSGTGGASNRRSGGGGGAGEAVTTGKNGGAGLQSSINGIPTFYAGGGGASDNRDGLGTTAQGSGGVGGGGAGGIGNGSAGNNGTTGFGQNGQPNTGGGGGGAFNFDSSGVGGAGGSGIVIVRYKIGTV